MASENNLSTASTYQTPNIFCHGCLNSLVRVSPRGSKIRRHKRQNSHFLIGFFRQYFSSSFLSFWLPIGKDPEKRRRRILTLSKLITLNKASKKDFISASECMNEKNSISRLENDYLTRYFQERPCQTAIMCWLLRKGHHSHNLIQICKLGEYLGFNKITLFKAISELNKRGWLFYYRKDIVSTKKHNEKASKFAFESYIGYPNLPLEFLNQVRQALAVAQGFPTWCDFMLSTEGKKPTRRSDRASYEPFPKTVGRKERSNVVSIATSSDLVETRPQASPLSRAENRANFEARYGGLKHTQRLDLFTREKRQKRHRYDPQGFPTRSLTAGITRDQKHDTALSS